MITLEEAWPPFALTITCGDLSLRVVRDEDLPELIEVALGGVHDPDAMPFLTPWTRQDPSVLPREMARWQWRTRADFTPEQFRLEFAVRVGGELVGTQDLGAAAFAVSRTAGTGSWLGQRFHGQGIGTRMRQVVCAFGFDVLEARTITSGAFLDNPASLAVSRKVGYQENGRGFVDRVGERAEEQKLLLRPEWFVRPADPVVVTGARPLLDYLGL